MKKYEKPMLAAFSLSADNVLLCACDDAQVKDWVDSTDPDTQILLASFGIQVGEDAGSNGWDSGDFAGMFGTSENDCSVKKTSELYYCKFTSDGTKILWS